MKSILRIKAILLLVSPVLAIQPLLAGAGELITIEDSDEGPGCATPFRKSGQIISASHSQQVLKVHDNLEPLQVNVPRPIAGYSQEIISISSLEILHPSYSLKLGPLTLSEAQVVATEINIEGGGWRLPTRGEVLALTELGIWKWGAAFKIKEVWADGLSQDLVELFDYQIRESRESSLSQFAGMRGYRGTAIQLARAIFARDAYPTAKWERENTYTFNLITQKERQVAKGSDDRYFALFVRSSK